MDYRENMRQNIRNYKTIMRSYSMRRSWKPKEMLKKLLRGSNLKNKKLRSMSNLWKKTVFQMKNMLN